MNIFLPDIQREIFGKGETLAAQCWQALAGTFCGLVGTAVALVNLRRHGARWLYVWGFALLAVLFGLMGLTQLLAPGAVGLLFVELLAVMFALNWGCNIASFVLPAVVFPPPVR